MSRSVSLIAGILMVLATASLSIDRAEANQVFSRSDIQANIVVDWASVFGPPGTTFGCNCPVSVDGLSFAVNGSGVQEIL